MLLQREEEERLPEAGKPEGQAPGLLAETGSQVPRRCQETPLHGRKGEVAGMETAYSKFDKSDLVLRDELAIDRTLLANERTLLAYLRSGIALVIAGVSIMHFSEENWFLAVGVACIPSGLFASVVGVARYRRMSRRISTLRKQPSRKQGIPDG